MTATRSFVFLIPLLAVACETTVVNGNTGGAGGNGGATGSATATTTIATTTTTVATTTSSATTTSTTTTSGSGGGADAQPPAPGPHMVADGIGSTTFAFSKIYFGDTDRDGTPDHANGWRQFGYDIDGKTSTASSTDLCQPLDNASPSVVYPDGNGGIDNSFGKLILPMLLGLEADFPWKQNDLILQGKQTFMLELVQLGSGNNYNPLPSRLYPGANLGAAPLFDGTDVWPIDPAGLTDPSDPSSAKVQFSTSYLVGNTWVGMGTGSIDLNLDAAGAGWPLALTIHNPIVTMDLDATHTSATGGTIAGVLLVSEFTAALKKTAGSFDPSLCSGATIDSIVAQISQAADILADGTQDHSKSCEAISIGLGFDAQTVTLGAVAAATPPPPNPCP